MPAPGAFEASTPAEAQTKPWRVSAITSGGRDADDARRTRAGSPRPGAGRASPASSRARSRRLDLVEPHDAALGLRDDLLRDDDDVAVLEPAGASAASASSAPRSSPSSTSGRPSSGMTRMLASREAGDADAGVRLVAPVHVHDHGGHPLERARARERAGVERAAGDEPAGELERELLRARRRRRRRARPRPAARLGERSRRRASAGRRRPARRAVLRSARRATSASGVGLHAVRRRSASSRATERSGVAPIASRSSRGGVERRLGLRRRARRGRRRGRRRRSSRPSTPSGRGRLARAVGVARADHDLVARRDEPLRERAAEAARAAEDRDLHAARPRARPRRAGARASASVISVRVTTRRTASSAGRRRPRRRRARRSAPRSRPRRARASCRRRAARASGRRGPSPRGRRRAG